MLVRVVDICFLLLIVVIATGLRAANAGGTAGVISETS